MMRTLDGFDKEILDLQGKLDPASNSYRYDAIRLDMLHAQRDLIALQNYLAQLEGQVASQGLQARKNELRISFLEIAVNTICKPESRQYLSVQIADAVCKQWEASMGKRLP